MADIAPVKPQALQLLRAGKQAFVFRQLLQRKGVWGQYVFNRRDSCLHFCDPADAPILPCISYFGLRHSTAALTCRYLTFPRGSVALVTSSWAGDRLNRSYADGTLRVSTTWAR